MKCLVFLFLSIHLNESTPIVQGHGKCEIRTTGKAIIKYKVTNITDVNIKFSIKYNNQALTCDVVLNATTTEVNCDISVISYKNNHLKLYTESLEVKGGDFVWQGDNTKCYCSNLDKILRNNYVFIF